MVSFHVSCGSDRIISPSNEVVDGLITPRLESLQMTRTVRTHDPRFNAAESCQRTVSYGVAHRGNLLFGGLRYTT